MGYDFKSHSTTSLENIKERCYNSEVILVNKDILTADHFKLLPNLKYVIVVATGYDNVDVIAAKQYGIKVSNIPDYGTQIVAQHAVALLLEVTNQVGYVSRQLQQSGNWYGIKQKHLELSGLTLGVIGFGRIAKVFIKIALALGMKVNVSSRQTNYETNLDVKFVDKETLFKTSDIISLHCQLNTDTMEIINKKSLSLMKKTSILINVSRGGLINESDLYESLLQKRIMGAALDVLTIEPATLDNPLLKLDNCIITPHNAWVSEGSLQRWLNAIIRYIKNFEKHEFINLI
jgi:glycerate dehydrogenase